MSWRLAGSSTDPERIAWSRFQRYWYGHLASFAGDWFTVLALPLAALAINKSPIFIGIVEFAELVATLLVGIRLGGLADRLPPRPVMIAADMIRAIALSTLALAFMWGIRDELVLIFVAFILGSMRDLHDGGESVLISSLVPESLLLKANARFQISDGLGHMVGSLLAGVAATFSLVAAFFADAASYVIAAVAVWSVGAVAAGSLAGQNTPETPENSVPGDEEEFTGSSRSWKEVFDALRFEDRYWRVVATMAATNTATVCFMGQFVTFATRILKLENWQIGLTLSAMGFGGFVAGLVIDRFDSITPRAILLAPLGIGAALLGAGWSRSWLVTLIGFVLVGAAIALGGALVGAMRHASFPTGVQGRIAMVSRVAFSLGVLGAVLAAGWIAARIGADGLYLLFGFVALSGTALGLALGVRKFETLA